MTQEQKDLLLLKDLCSRLPYDVKVNCNDKVYNLNGIQYFNICILTDDNEDNAFTTAGIKYIKPYLFPLSSMTEEQRYDFYCRFIENEIDYNDFKEFYFENNMWHKMLTSIDDCDSVIDWFHKNHFDHRGLIPMGLAEDATGLNVY